jgi:hypothetical protein
MRRILVVGAILALATVPVASSEAIGLSLSGAPLRMFGEAATINAGAVTCPITPTFAQIAVIDFGSVLNNDRIFVVSNAHFNTPGSAQEVLLRLGPPTGTATFDTGIPGGLLSYDSTAWRGPSSSGGQSVVGIYRITGDGTFQIEVRCTCGIGGVSVPASNGRLAGYILRKGQ